MTVSKCSICDCFADGRIRSWKRPLYQLSHNHCPKQSKVLRLQLVAIAGVALDVSENKVHDLPLYIGQWSNSKWHLITSSHKLATVHVWLAGHIRWLQRRSWNFICRIELQKWKLLSRRQSETLFAWLVGQLQRISFPLKRARINIFRTTKKKKKKRTKNERIYVNDSQGHAASKWAERWSNSAQVNITKWDDNSPFPSSLRRTLAWSSAPSMRRSFSRCPSKNYFFLVQTKLLFLLKQCSTMEE